MVHRSTTLTDGAGGAAMPPASVRCWWKGAGGWPAHCWPREWSIATTGSSHQSGWATPGFLAVSGLPGTSLGGGGTLAGGRAAGAGPGHPSRRGSGAMFTGIVTAVGRVREADAGHRGPEPQDRRALPRRAPGREHRRRRRLPHRGTGGEGVVRRSRRHDLARAHALRPVRQGAAGESRARPRRWETGWAGTWCRATSTGSVRWSG